MHDSRSDDATVVTRGLGKSYPGVDALRDVDLRVHAGAVLGVLGHNGAGKSTLVDILATRTRPSSGAAFVCGHDVLRRPREVRRRIGVTSQSVALDEQISGRANLVLLARLLGARPKAARARAEELLERFGLADAADRLPRTYSGGMRRRLDLAASLLGRPDVLFLDEPTTGLDPVAKTAVWAFVEYLTGEGTTVVLTTQDLDEAERLASDIVVLGQGAVVVSGTPARLKSTVGARVATARLAAGQAGAALALLARQGFAAQPAAAAVTVAGQAALEITVDGPADLARAVRILDAGGVDLADLVVREPTLIDVYLALHRAGVPAPQEAAS